jgi:hypothetical protein
MGLFDFFKKENKKADWEKLMPAEMLDMIKEQIRSNPQACSSDVIPQGVGEFGLEKANPIPVYGIPSNEEYLNSLLLKDGSKFTHRRVGSLEVESIECPIDQYEIFDRQGETICVIYLSPYHWKNSKRCPKGFKFK